ncbi:glutathione S-transferase domain protein [Pseudogulbenkiania sp. NH8B]|uniref:glutathione S-transferase family protein n=1 Tax=Pseudogulbenkiania sp. (strain NH8B) TaxID=748280 RepID=UPI000227A431|nr:glutathione S-transferase family protein [Pseudogulbenkiania sp. NH8B]BAK78184.1 glutathione S-transferase domain protein [Pseudogulbenkiania sp. NH8B]
MKENPMFTLVIGNKNSSSWSLRPWLVLKMLDEPFNEQLIPLFQPDTKSRILAANPAGKVPVLLDGQLRVWDSLAICEYLAECFPAARLWPEDLAERSLARSVAAEMHSGFAALRQHLPMDIVSRHSGFAVPEAAAADIRRIVELWEELLHGHQDNGPFLFGHFTIADAMYAPVVARFVSYDVALPARSQAYADHILELPAMQQWYDEAEAEIAAGGD